MPTQLYVRMQINIALGDISNMENTDRCSNLVIPLVWTEIVSTVSLSSFSGASRIFPWERWGRGCYTNIEKYVRRKYGWSRLLETRIIDTITLFKQNSKMSRKTNRLYIKNIQNQSDYWNYIGIQYTYIDYSK